MKTCKLGFSREQLRKGALMGTIAHAIWVVANPHMAAMQSWDGQDYLLNDMSGCLGAVTFADDAVVAAFYDGKSSRNPLATGAPYSADHHLAGLPDSLLRLAKSETLEYMLQELDGKAVPVITAALWSEGVELVAAESWEDVSEHGGRILRIQLMDEAAALAAWREDYGLSEQQVDLLRSLYEAKLGRGETLLALSDAQKALMEGAGAQQAKEILASIGIDV